MCVVCVCGVCVHVRACVCVHACVAHKCVYKYVYVHNSLSITIYWYLKLLKVSNIDRWSHYPPYISLSERFKVLAEIWSGSANTGCELIQKPTAL